MQAKRVSQRLGENINLMPGVISSRLPLQKSISTPSIILPPGQNLVRDAGGNGAPSLSV